MTKNIKNSSIDNTRTSTTLHEVYAKGQPDRLTFEFRSIMDRLAQLKRNRHATKVRGMSISTGVPEAHVREVFSILEGLHLGELVLGRRGSSTRFEWMVPPSVVGHAAVDGSPLMATVQETATVVPPTPAPVAALTPEAIRAEVATLILASPVLNPTQSPAIIAQNKKLARKAKI